MSGRSRVRLAILCSLLSCAVFVFGEDNQQQKLERQFQSAVKLYDAGQFQEAAAQLEVLVPKVPNSFEAQELMGLVYSSLSQDTRAIEHLEAAVRLKPDSAAARTNLAASLTHA